MGDEDSDFDPEELFLEDIQFDPADLRAAVLPLIDFSKQDDFWVIEETVGLKEAMAYSVALNCIESLANTDEGSDWVSELIRKAFLELSPEAQAAFAETGL